MEVRYMVFTAAGAAAVIVGGIFSTYQIYRLVQTDAECRGMKRPGLWGLFSVSGNGQTGLLLYLIVRRRHPVVSMSGEQKALMGKRKKKFGAGLVFLAVGAVVCVMSLFLGQGM